MPADQEIASAKKHPAEGDDAEFDALLEKVLANPESLEDPEAFTEEQILRLAGKLDPYSARGGQAPDPESGKTRLAALSYTNLREDYLRRYTMTSLVGFLFQLLHEWEVPVPQRSWIPQRKGDPPGPAALVSLLEEALATAKKATAAVEKADEAMIEDAAASTAESAEAKQQADGEAAALFYVASAAARRVGEEATRAMAKAAADARKHPEMAAILGNLAAAPEAVEMPADVAKGIISGFLRRWLEFDPSVHVRSGHNAAKLAASLEEMKVAGGKGGAVVVDKGDSRHLTLSALRGTPAAPSEGHADVLRAMKAHPKGPEVVAALLQDSDLAAAAVEALADPQAFRHYLLPVPLESEARPAADIVPPQDTFSRWAFYSDVNYEALRAITEAIYPERPDLDLAVAVWEHFEGTPKEADEAFKKHCRRYQDELPSDIFAVTQGQWTLMGSFKKNRDKLDFYNKETAVIERILDRHASDKKIGKELMKNRVYQSKAANIAQEGPDAPGLSGYRREMAGQGRDLAAQGAARVISPEDMKRLEKARGNVKAAKELELHDQLQKTIADLEERQALLLKAGEDLSEVEKIELKGAKRDLERAKEMLAVPENAVQVDMFVTDAAAGEFRKENFYTMSDEALGGDEKEPDEGNAAAENGSRHPAVRMDAVRRALAAGGDSFDVNKLAPFAREQLLRDLEKEREGAGTARAP